MSDERDEVGSEESREETLRRLAGSKVHTVVLTREKVKNFSLMAIKKNARQRKSRRRY